MELRNIILELGVDKDGDSFCKEIRNNTVEVESSWCSYKALDYVDNYTNCITYSLRRSERHDSSHESQKAK